MSARLLASMVAARLDGHDPEVCAAWIDSADRVCGRPVVAPWLCKRHETVARKRLAREVEKDRARRERAAVEAERLRPKREARLAWIEARLHRLDPPVDFDHGMVNLPLSKRMPSDARIHEVAELHREAAALRRDLGVTA